MDVEILLQALPYIRRHKGTTLLVKMGGALADDVDALGSLALDLALLVSVGIRVCVVHGGGPQATELANRLGVEQQFVEGRRITDEATLEVTKMVFAGKINLEILAALRAEGLRAVGLSGVSADILHATRRPPTEVKNHETGETSMVDMGHVGDIQDVDGRLLRVLMDEGYVPVVNPLGADQAGNVLNINADTVAMRLAAELDADKFLLLTDVRGILRDPDDPESLVSSITAPRSRMPTWTPAASLRCSPTCSATPSNSRLPMVRSTSCWPTIRMAGSSGCPSRTPGAGSTRSTGRRSSTLTTR